jgi:heme a synthase
MNPVSLVDPAPAIRMALVCVAVSLLPLAWTWWRRRTALAKPGVDRPSWLRALTLTTMILTFDLVLFGSFTRLTDSGLGCPDWPGCYGHASPIGARSSIDAAVAVQPDGPVTHAKAWIEMIHRYFAMTVGLLIVLMTIEAWRERRRVRTAHLWASITLVWVIVQGAFGALTVTMRLYPAIVTLHLLLGLGLLALLAIQAQALAGSAGAGSAAWRAPPSLRMLALVVSLLLVVLGGWVSTNYAVLACRDFPTCQGQWWPPMDPGEGFVLMRQLGRSGDGVSYLPFAALTAIHVAHRLGALVLVVVLAVLLWALWRTGEPAARRGAAWLAGLAAWQVASGASNVVLGWPILAALAHVAGAAGFSVVLVTLLTRMQVGRAAAARAEPLPRARVASTS